MFVTNHLLLGAAVGLATRRPVVAFAVAGGAHLALDAVPHWGDVSRPVFLAVAVADGLVGLLLLAVAARTAPPGARLATLAGMAGAVVPDLDKPAAWLGLPLFPGWVDRLHGGIQTESAGLWWTEALVAALLAAVVLGLRRRVVGRARRAAVPDGPEARARARATDAPPG